MVLVTLITILALIVVLGVDTIYINDDGIKDDLDTWTDNLSPSNLSSGFVELNINATPVDHTTVLAGVTVATFPGYAHVSVASLLLPGATVTTHVAAALAAVAASFTRTATGAPQSVYGAYITDSTGTLLLASWNFTGGPFIMQNAGDNIKTTPTLTTQSLN